MKHRQTGNPCSAGFTLVELLIVVAIIGIIAAIAIPNLLDAMDRARFKRSSVDMRTLGLGVEAYKVDFGGNVPSASNVSEAIVILKNNNYVSQIPGLDGWGILFSWDTGFMNSDGAYVSGTGSPGNTSYRIGCGGLDLSVPQVSLDDDAMDPALLQSRETSRWSCDIIFGDGAFMFGSCS